MSKAHRNAISAAVSALIGAVMQVVESEAQLIDLGGLDEAERAKAERLNAQQVATRSVVQSAVASIGALIETALHDLNRIADSAGQNDPGPIGARQVPVHAVGDEDAAEVPGRTASA